MKRKTFALFHSIRTDCGVLALALQQKYRSEEKINGNCVRTTPCITGGKFEKFYECFPLIDEYKQRSDFTWLRAKHDAEIY